MQTRSEKPVPGLTPPNVRMAPDLGDNRSHQSKERSGRSRRRSLSRGSGSRSSGHDDQAPNSGEDYEQADVSHLKVHIPTNELYREACDFNTYRLNNRNVRYNSQDKSNVRRMRRDLDTQMRPHQFDGQHPITVLNFLKEFQEACNMNGVHEGAARWIIRNYLKKNALTFFDTSVAGKKRTKKRLDTYCDIVNFMLTSYAKNEFIAKCHADISTFKADRTTTEPDYAQALLNKSNSCGSVYPETVLLGYFVEGCHPSIRSSVRAHLAANPEIDLLELAEHALSMGNIARIARTEEDPRRQDRKDGRRKGKGEVATVTTGKSGKKADARPEKPAASSAVSTPTPSTMSAPTPANAVFAVQGNPTQGHPSASGYSTSVGSLAPIGPALPARPARSPSPGRAGPQPCRLCLGLDHDQTTCPMLPSDKLSVLNRAREDNLQRLRTLGYYSNNRDRSRSRSPGRQGSYSYSTRHSPAPAVRTHDKEQSKN